MKLLMLSSSRCGQEPYLQTARSMILPFLQDIQDLLFIPYAGVTLNWDDYTEKVQAALPEHNVRGIHQTDDPVRSVLQAKAILVGGGNTFHLLHQLYRNQLIEPIKRATESGTPYVGWSAGSNICGQSIRTTNDMPIIQPPSFTALDLVPFQLNPHYSDYQPPGHNGETRAERIAEFCVLNPETPVVGIREGNALRLENGELTHEGHLDGVIFRGNQHTRIAPSANLSDLLNR